MIRILIVRHLVPTRKTTIPIRATITPNLSFTRRTTIILMKTTMNLMMTKKKKKKPRDFITAHPSKTSLILTRKISFLPTPTPNPTPNPTPIPTPNSIEPPPPIVLPLLSPPSPADFSPSHRSSPMIDFVFEPDLKADEASRPFNSMFPSNRDVLDGLPDLQSSISPVTPVPLDDDLLPPLRVRDYSRIVEQLSVAYALDPHFRRLHNELQARVPSLFYWCVVADSVVDCQTPGWWAKRYPCGRGAS